MNWPFVIHRSLLILAGGLLVTLLAALARIIFFTSFLTHLFVDHDLGQHLKLGLGF